MSKPKKEDSHGRHTDAPKIYSGKKSGLNGITSACHAHAGKPLNLKPPLVQALKKGCECKTDLSVFDVRDLGYLNKANPLYPSDGEIKQAICQYGSAACWVAAKPLNYKKIQVKNLIGKGSFNVDLTVSYDVKGFRRHDKNNFPVGQSRTRLIPTHARNITVRARAVGGVGLFLSRPIPRPGIFVLIFSGPP